MSDTYAIPPKKWWFIFFLGFKSISPGELFHRSGVAFRFEKFQVGKLQYINATLSFFFCGGGWTTNAFNEGFSKKSAWRTWVGNSSFFVLCWEMDHHLFSPPQSKINPVFFGWLPPPSLTWNLKMMVSKRNLFFQGAIFRFHVKLWMIIRIHTLNKFFETRIPKGYCCWWLPSEIR